MDKNARGQTLIEYALIIAFLAVAAIAALVTLDKQFGTFSRLNAAINAAAAANGGSH